MRYSLEQRLALLLWLRRRRERRRTRETRRRWWVHPVNQLREEYGAYSNLVEELRDDPDRFFNFHRMSPVMFDELLSLVEPQLTKFWVTREPISPGLRLSLTLRFVLLYEFQLVN